MLVFDTSSTQRTPTPWGLEVKKRLLDKRLKQVDLVNLLKSKGYGSDKVSITNLLYGAGTKPRADEIRIISEFLGIPFVDTL